MNTIQYQVKSVYGRDLYYPINDYAKHLLKDCLEQETFTENNIKKLADSGYYIMERIKI